MNQRSIKRSLGLLLTAAMLVPQASPVFAANLWDAISDYQKPNLNYGPVEFHPYYNLSETYDDNVLLNPKGNKAGQTAWGGQLGPVAGSWITSNDFGLGINAPISEMHRFNLNYDVNDYAFSNDPHVNNYVAQDLKGGYTYKGPMGLTGKVADEYLNTADYATTELTTRQKRWNNTVAAAGEYAPEGGYVFGGVDATHSIDKYIDNTFFLANLLNRYTDTAGLSAGWQMDPKTRVYAAYHLQDIHYTDQVPYVSGGALQSVPSKDNHSDLVDFGIKGDIAPKLTGQIQTGFVYRHYDAVQPSGQQQTRNWTVATNLTYSPIERTKIDLSLVRALQESTFDDDTFFIENTAALNITHKLPYKLTLGVNGSVNIDKYPQNLTVATAQSYGVGTAAGPRRDDTYQGGISLKYDIQEWLNTGVSYLHRQRFSTYSQQFNYTDNQTMWTVGVLF